MSKRKRTIETTSAAVPWLSGPKGLTERIGRREFVMTTGGILVAAGIGCSSSTDNELGTIRVNITGLAAGAASAGVVTVTPTAGGTPVTVNIPPAGTQEAQVPAGTYSVSYTPPAGYALASGSTVPSTVTITAGQVTTVDLALTQQAGTIQIVVTGIASGSADGGSASVTPSGGGTAVTINIPAAGTGSGGFAPGSYVVTYTPPSGHTLSSGASPQTVTVSSNQTVVINYTVAVVVQTGTLTITVTGITPGTANGGSASVSPTGGGSAVTVNVAANGTGSGTFVAGSYSVTYTPPAAHTISSGTNPQTVTITANQTTNIAYTVTASQAFPTPDLRNNVSFETTFDGFTNWSSGTPTGITRDTTRAFDGAFALRKVLPVTSGSDIGSQCVYRTSPNFDRIWGRFYFYLDAAINGTFKFNLFFDSGFNVQFGGIYIASGFLSVFHTPEINQFTRLVNISGLTNAWHSVEVDYWRNGDTSNGGDFPSMGIWLDGTQITSAATTPPAPASFQNGRLNFGTRASSVKIGYYELLGLINGAPANTVAGNVWVDKVSISTLGRIGP